MSCRMIVESTFKSSARLETDVLSCPGVFSGKRMMICVGLTVFHAALEFGLDMLESDDALAVGGEHEGRQ
jgi:hypothetical protein